MELIPEEREQAESILDETRKTLEELARSSDVPMAGAYYGTCTADHLDEWNYFVFNRTKTSKASNRCDLQTRYEVHIIHENCIPEGYVQTVIDAIEAQSTRCAGAKMKATSVDIPYEYITKGNTDVVVEVATITFVRPEKRV